MQLWHLHYVSARFQSVHIFLDSSERPVHSYSIAALLEGRSHDSTAQRLWRSVVLTNLSIVFVLDRRLTFRVLVHRSEDFHLKHIKIIFLLFRTTLMSRAAPVARKRWLVLWRRSTWQTRTGEVSLVTLGKSSSLSGHLPNKSPHFNLQNQVN